MIRRTGFRKVAFLLFPKKYNEELERLRKSGGPYGYIKITIQELTRDGYVKIIINEIS